MTARPPVLTLAVAETSLGVVAVAASEAGIQRSTLLHPSAASALDSLARYGQPGGHPIAAAAAAALHAYANGDFTALDLVPLDPPAASPFQRSVWLALRAIPAGETRSYGWLAAAIGQPAAVRAVGAANGVNPLPLFLPCHRVIGSDGSLRGFGGGLEMKRRLLDHEATAARQRQPGFDALIATTR